LSCDADGVSLGGAQLLRRAETGFEPRSPFELDLLTKAGFGAALDVVALSRGLGVAARALNDGDVGRAMIAAVHLRLPELGAIGALRLAAVDAALAKYAEDEPRDWHGRWTTGGSTGGPNPIESSHSGRHLVDGSAGGEGDDGEGAGIGDNQGPSLEPVGPTGEAPPPDPVLPTPKVQAGWDQPARVENGVQRPAERVPRRADGRLWPTAEPDRVIRILDQRRGTMKIYVPLDGKGPILLGSTETEDLEQPPGYSTVYLRGIPQRTYSGGVETGHARASVDNALRFAETDEYSEIFFNQSFRRISGGKYDSSLRGDVVGLRRPDVERGGEYDVFESLSPRQNGPAREQVLRDAVPGIRNFESRAYKLLLKLLRALGIS
jgi:hypothetical protein